MKKQYAALVVGAGIGGIRAALDLASAGHRVALIDRRPHHGGILAQLDHQFPTDHCGMCRMLPLMSRDSSSQFCLRKGLYHENIDLMLNTELSSLEGEPGKFFATLNRRATFVDPTKCVSCGLCSDVCPVRVPSEFNAGLTERAAVYLPVPHALPNRYVLDLDSCQRCWKCHEACPTGAIDFRFEARRDFTVLVADSDPATAEFVAESVRELGFPVESVSSGAEAVERLAAQPGENGDSGSQSRIGMLLLGISDANDEQTASGDMPPDRVIARAGELAPGLPVVVLADAGQEDRAADLVMQGARDYLIRPLRTGTLVPWLDKLFMRAVSDTSDVVEAGAVILAAGFECYRPDMDPQGGEDIWRYNHPGVLTAVEFERLLSGTGPTGGKLERPGDGRPVNSIAWIQCVGSRDVQKNADFCTGICCMFSLKEAVLAKEATNGAVEASIFYMDMRTAGKEYQRYRDRAEKEKQVRFVRTRPHSVFPQEDGSLRIEYVTDDGAAHAETFDMVVLAAGARPPANMRGLVLATGIETNDWGFCDTQPYASERTSRVGVFAAGAFGEPRDIAESVIHSSAAAQAASRVIRAYGTLDGSEPDQPDTFPDVSREMPKTMVALCTSCPTLEARIDFPTMRDRLRRVYSVDDVVGVPRMCTADGWSELESRMRNREEGGKPPNRVVLGACLPYAYIPRLRELGRTVGLNPALMDVVDIYSPLFTRESGKGGKNFLQADADGADPSEDVSASVYGDTAGPSGRPRPEDGHDGMSSSGTVPPEGLASEGEMTAGRNSARRLVPDTVAREIHSRLATAVTRLQGADPVPPPVMVDVEHSALVVGGGLAGMTAALGIAEHGHNVCIVEKEPELGGMAMNHRTQLDGTDPRRFMEDLIDQVVKHPKVRVLTDSRVVLSRGSVGRFQTAVSGPGGVFTMEHGVTVLATGGQEAKVYDKGLCVQKSVMTHPQLEDRLASGELDAGALSAVAMIQCWRNPGEERSYCSRVCCPGMLKNVLTLKERNPDLSVYVFYRDIMTPGFSEAYYTKARQAGAVFIRYDADSTPQVAFEHGRPVITAVDPVLGREVEIHADILSLSSGIEPAEVDDLVEIFGVETDDFGFFSEADSKWRPVDFLKQGLFMCGVAQAPRNMRDTAASAKAAARRALRILDAGRIARETVVAIVRESLCSGCGVCVSACPYGARSINAESGRVSVDGLLCQGCGACAAVCPNSATVIGGFSDAPVMASIDAALEELF